MRLNDNIMIMMAMMMIMMITTIRMRLT